MDNKEIKEGLAELAKKYPGVKKVNLHYYGSGDSFDSYYVDVIPDIKVINSDFEDIFWHLIDTYSGGFNDEGSEGVVKFDLENQTVKITDYYRIETTELNQEVTI